MNPMPGDVTRVDPRRSGLGFLATLVEAARQTGERLIRRRGAWLMPAMLLAFAALAYVLGARAVDRMDGRRYYSLLAWWVLGTVVIPWSTLYLAVQTVHGEIEDRTYQYLFLRPVGRAPLLLGRWLAVAVVAALQAAFAAFALFAAVVARSDFWPDGVDWSIGAWFAVALMLGCVAYAAVGVWFAAAFRRPLVWSAVFAVGLQMIAANLPVSAGLRAVTITDPLRRMVLDWIEPDARLADMLWPAEDFKPDVIGHPVWHLLAIAAVALVLAVWSYARTEYDSRSRE